MIGLYNFFASKGQMVAFLIGLVGVVVVIATVLSGLSGAGYDVGTDLNVILKGENEETFDFFNMAIMIPVVIMCLTAAVILIFGLLRLVTDPKGSMKFILGALVIFGLFFIFYSMATPETAGKLGELHGRFNIGETASKLISGGIKTTGLLAIASVVLMLLSGIMSIFK